MSIGDDIKKVIDHRADAAMKFKNAFDAAMKDAKAKGLSVTEVNAGDETFVAYIEGIKVTIDTRQIINEFKVTKDLPLVSDEGATTAVKNAILEQLKL